MKNPNAIWFQVKESLFAQVMLVNNRYRFEVYSVYVYPRWYARPKSGKVVLEGDADTLPLAKKEVFKFLDK